MANKQKAPAWYLEGPFHRYKEDVKELARKAGVRIIDARFVAEQDRGNAAEEVPKATLKAAPKKATTKE